MALVTCDDCKHDVSDQAPACPNCGRPIARWAPAGLPPTADAARPEEPRKLNPWTVRTEVSAHRVLKGVVLAIGIPIVLVALAVGAIIFLKSSPEVAAVQAGANPIEVGRGCKTGSKQAGEACVRDGECASVECKSFKCVPRSEARPFLSDGAKCRFDGDCCSGQCRGLQCISVK